MALVQFLMNFSIGARLITVAILAVLSLGILWGPQQDGSTTGSLSDARNEIAQQITSITNQNTQIERAPEKQSAASEGINQNVVNIRAISMASTESSQETMATSLRLRHCQTNCLLLFSNSKGVKSPPALS